MEELKDIFGNYIFPIGITIYLLTRMEKVIDENTKKIDELKDTLIDCMSKIRGRK
jgi:hypothetical protein